MVPAFSAFFAIFLTDVLCSVPLRSRHKFFLWAHHVNTFNRNGTSMIAAKYALFGVP